MRLKNSAEREGQLTSVSNKFPVNLVTQIENVCYLARDVDSFVGVSPIFAHSTMGDLYHSYSAPYPLLLPRIFIYLDGDQPLPLPHPSVHSRRLISATCRHRPVIHRVVPRTLML